MWDSLGEIAQSLLDIAFSLFGFNIDLETIENGCYSSYAEALNYWIDDISNDIKDLGVWDEDKGHDFYLSVEQIEYCGLKEQYQEAKDYVLEMFEEDLDEIDK